MQEKNILILCDYFPPTFAPRMGYLCKYLPATEWKSVVVSEYVSFRNYYQELAKGQHVIYINYYFSRKKAMQFLKHTFVRLADLLFNYKDLIIRKKAERIVRENDISLIVASSFRLFPALAASKISQKYNIPLVVDLRDIFEQSSNDELVIRKIFRWQRINHFFAKRMKKKLTRQRNRVLQNAAAVTTVSEWHAGFLSQYNPNTHLIFNGFDPDLFFHQTIRNEKFVIVFTGKVHSKELRDPSLLFEATARLSASGKINPTVFHLHFYLTDSFSKQEINVLAEKYRISDFIHYFDGVPNVEIPKILNESSILLLLANKSTGEKSPKGIMGTKTFEYLAVEKPILCVRNDEDCLEQTICAANAGLAASTVDEVEAFILEKYAEWQQNGCTHQAGNQEYIQQFSRKRQAEQFAQLFKTVISHAG